MLYKRGLLDVGDLLENGSSQREYERRAGIIPWPHICPAVLSKKRELQRARMCHVFTFSDCITGGHRVAVFLVAQLIFHFDCMQYMILLSYWLLFDIIIIIFFRFICNMG